MLGHVRAPQSRMRINSYIMFAREEFDILNNYRARTATMGIASDHVNVMQSAKKLHENYLYSICQDDPMMKQKLLNC